MKQTYRFTLGPMTTFDVRVTDGAVDGVTVNGWEATLRSVSRTEDVPRQHGIECQKETHGECNC